MTISSYARWVLPLVGLQHRVHLEDMLRFRPSREREIRALSLSLHLEDMLRFRGETPAG